MLNNFIKNITNNPRHVLYLLLGIFASLFLIFSFIYYWHYYTTDELAKITPADVMFFGALKKPILYSNYYDLKNPELKNLYSRLDKILGLPLNFEKDILPFVDQQAALIITANNEPILIFKTTEQNIIENNFAGLNYYWVKKKIIAVSTEQLELKNFFSSTQNLSKKLSGRFKSFGIIKIYKNFLVSNNFTDDKTLLLADVDDQFLPQNNLYKKFVQFQDIVIIINKKANLWQLSASAGHIDINDYQTISAAESAIKYLPKNYMLYAKNLSLKEFLKLNFFNNDNSYSYFKTEVAPNLLNNFDLLLYNNEAPKNLFYVLGFKLIQQSVAQNYASKFKQFAALNWPQAEIKTLPDKTKSINLVSNPVNLQFIEISPSSFYLKDAAKIGYEFQAENLLISNSSPYLSSKNNLDLLADKLKACWLIEPASFLLLKHDLGLGFSEIYLKINPDFTISGCLIQ